MKKIRKAGMILLAVFCTAMFLGCPVNDGDKPKPQELVLGDDDDDYPGDTDTPKHDYGIWNEDTLYQIVQDYLDTSVWFYTPEAPLQGVWAGYYGTYNRSHALILVYGLFGMVNFKYNNHPPLPFFSGQEVTEIVAGIHFTFPDKERVITIWDDGVFYSLSEAYELELLSRDDVQAIAGMYQLQGIDFGQNLFDKLPEHGYRIWNEKTSSQVLRDITDAFINLLGNPYFPDDGFEYNGPPWISYYGTYAGSHVVLTNYPASFTLEHREEVIGNITFQSGNHTKIILVWKNGTFFSLENAFALGLLTMDDIQNIHDIHYGKY